MLILKIKNKVINRIGCIVARWILHNCADGLVIRQKGGAEQIIKVFGGAAYRNVIRPAIHKATEVIKVGDVVTDNGYHGEVVVTNIYYDKFRGYYLTDGVTVSGLVLKDFKKIVGHVDVKIKETGRGSRHGK
ncbi:hypothetical protein D7V82_14605 [bacterium 1xD8-6]|nr:hypothetical protein D7V72_16025 [bacterium D16-36]RKI66544.1 hypothetical protein D7V82_14605 [bacterium 1xD8-6]